MSLFEPRDLFSPGAHGPGSSPGSNKSLPSPVPLLAEKGCPSSHAAACRVGRLCAPRALTLPSPGPPLAVCYARLPLCPPRNPFPPLAALLSAIRPLLDPWDAGPSTMGARPSALHYASRSTP